MLQKVYDALSVALPPRWVSLAADVSDVMAVRFRCHLQEQERSLGAVHHLAIAVHSHTSPGPEQFEEDLFQCLCAFADFFFASGP